MEQLVLDTLHDRRRSGDESCLVVNVAGIELLKSGPEAIPVIEGILSAVVAPAERQAVDFPGLPYVMGAYLVLASRSGHPGVSSFLQSLPRALQREAVNAVPTFFRMMKDGFNFGTAPGNNVLRFLHHARISPDGELREAAESVARGLPAGTVPPA